MLQVWQLHKLLMNKQEAAPLHLEVQLFCCQFMLVKTLPISFLPLPLAAHLCFVSLCGLKHRVQIKKAATRAASESV